jgi:hypothetical protein
MRREKCCGSVFQRAYRFAGTASRTRPAANDRTGSPKRSMRIFPFRSRILKQTRSSQLALKITGRNSIDLVDDILIFSSQDFEFIIRPTA